MQNSFSYERFRTETRYETEAQDDSEMAYSPDLLRNQRNLFKGLQGSPIESYENCENIAQNAATHPGTFLCEAALNYRLKKSAKNNKEYGQKAATRPYVRLFHGHINSSG